MTITREEVLRRIQRTKELKMQGAREMMFFLQGMHYAETGEMLDESKFVVW